MRLKVVVNPKAGRGRVTRKIDAVLRTLRRLNTDFAVDESRSAEHLRELGRDAAAQGFDRLIVCGGDGTVNQVVRHLDLERITLAVIPLGSGDDFARTVGIPTNPVRAAETAMGGVVREVDVARANGERFLITASVGFDAAVARFASTVSNLRGPIMYGYSALRLIRHFNPIPMRVTGYGLGVAGWESDNRLQPTTQNPQLATRNPQPEIEENVMFVVVANAHRYGGGFRVAPAARIDDRILDLYVISACSKLDLLLTMPLAYFGLHRYRRFVHWARGEEFTLEPGDPSDVFADGEFLTTTPVTIDLEPRRLRVVVPSR